MKGNLIISRNNGFYNIKNNLIKVNIEGSYNKVINPFRITDLYIHGHDNNIEIIRNGKINHIKVFGNNNKIYINNNSTCQYNNRGNGNELIKKNNNFLSSQPPNRIMPMNPFLINNNINYNNNFFYQNNYNNYNNSKENKVNDILNNLEEKLYSEIPLILKIDNLNKCSLCQTLFLENEKILIYSCKLHIFHKDCLKNWIQSHLTSPSCPKCSNINEINKLNLDLNANPFSIRLAPPPQIQRPRNIFDYNNNIHLRSDIFHDNDDIDNLDNDLVNLNLNDDLDDDENEFDDNDDDDLYFGLKKGLNQNILDNLEISKMKNVEKLDEDKKKCTICLEYYQNGDDSIALPCIHIFHAECVKTWLRNNNTCPICKNEIKYDEYEYDEDY